MKKKKQTGAPTLTVILNIDEAPKNTNAQKYSQALVNDAKKFMESANRSILSRQEELIKKQQDLLHSKIPHSSLNFKSPVQYLLEYHYECHMYWTYTKI